MPQQTNLNISPYFDDYNVDKNYYKVLFKPGTPVQARELTGLQSILQNQIEQFGNHIFKEGSVVIPGNLKYQNPVTAVEIEPVFNGLPISLYFNELLGKKIRGQSSGVTAEIFYILSNTDSERGNYTIYVNFLGSGGDFSKKIFDNGEVLLVEEDLNYQNTLIPAGQGFCNTIASNSVSDASYVSLNAGVYFVRGIFASVSAQSILLDQYGVEPSYKVGFNVEEDVVNSYEDETLYDNSQGFSNYAAPGADRFRLNLTLTKKSLSDVADTNFVEIFRVNSGVPTYASSENPTYNIIRDELARRTFDESGNYVVNPFTLYVRDCLNDRYSSNGLYYSNQLTAEGNAPSEDLMVYQIGPGKAYVNGYEVETISTRLLDVPKPRTTKKEENVLVNFNAGTLFVVDNTYGAASVGLGTTSVINLTDSRLGTNKSISSGNIIGQARVYDYTAESSYEDNTSRMYLRLFDIDVYTRIGISTSITLTTPTHIKGKTSNATGFLKNSVSNSNTLTLYSVSGTFLENEKLIINGIENNRLVNSVVDYNISDIKSVYSTSGITTFSGDTCLTNRVQILPSGTSFGITSASSGISTVSVGLNYNFINKVKVGDIISYADPLGTATPIYNKVSSVSVGGTFFTISGITTVSGICNGALPSSNVTVNNLVKITPEVFDNDNGLLTPLPERNISNVYLETTTITQRRTFKNQTVSNSSLSISISDADVFFAAFDEDRYLITYSDGTVETLRSDKFAITNNGKTATFIDLSKSSGTVEVVATIQNTKPNPKIKKLNKVSTITIDKSSLTSSGIGTTTLNDGLTYSQIYGIRVQDEDISLNVPDVVRVLGIYESSSSAEPSIPKVQLSSFTGPNNSNVDYILGEVIKGEVSGAVGIIVSRVDSDKLEFCYLNGFQFSENEIITGENSGIKSIVIQTYLSDKNIINNYLFSNGQTPQIYDYSRIRRKGSVPIPKGKLKIVFQNYTIDSNDTGEFISINSYPAEEYKFNIPKIADFSLSDFIDIRPRVKPYNSASNKSPFEYDVRDLTFEGTYSNYNIVPDDNIVLSYDYYLSRIDKVVLNKDGTLEILQGVPDKNPLTPADKVNSITIGTVYNSPYLYDIRESNVIMQEYKRYRMSDISLLEDRIKRLEDYTTLSLAEMKTESLVIRDAETGLDRFKCGFFVDNFTTNIVSDVQNVQFKSAVSGGYCFPIRNEVFIPLQLGSSAIEDFTETFDANLDQSYVDDLGSPGVRQTGDLITLNYTELLYDEQEYATGDTIIDPNRFWRGQMTLSPSEDTWYDEVSIETTSFNSNTITNPVSDKNITVTENNVEDKVVWRNAPSFNRANTTGYYHFIKFGSTPDYFGPTQQRALTNITQAGSVAGGLANITIGGQIYIPTVNGFVSQNPYLSSPNSLPSVNTGNVQNGTYTNGYYSVPAYENIRLWQSTKK
jgi:hypothetical protein